MVTARETGALGNQYSGLVSRVGCLDIFYLIRSKISRSKIIISWNVVLSIFSHKDENKTRKNIPTNKSGV